MTPALCQSCGTALANRDVLIVGELMSLCGACEPWPETPWTTAEPAGAADETSNTPAGPVPSAEPMNVTSLEAREEPATSGTSRTSTRSSTSGGERRIPIPSTAHFPSGVPEAMEPLRAPFPYFGGKSRAAEAVWRAFGNVPNYVEPFFGSGAVLLLRPHEAKIETVNDADAFLCNFWRAVTAEPDAVAEWCDWPVQELDMHARHAWLVAQSERVARLRSDPDFYDVKIAGWWVWGLSMWIGAGWCQESRVDRNSGARPMVNGKNAGQGVHKLPKKRPVVASAGLGVHKLMLRSQGSGVHGATVAAGQKPDLQGQGRGINAPTSHLPSLGNMRGVLGPRTGRWSKGAPRTLDGPPCLEWFRALQARLRRVRVCCGDWSRVATNSVLGTNSVRHNCGMSPCAVFLDPPYDTERRAGDLYSEDNAGLASKVAQWAREHGEDPDLRIALCGYEGEHEMPPSWTCFAWTANRGYSGEDNDNRKRERIWFSPHCLPLEGPQASLFGEGA